MIKSCTPRTRTDRRLISDMEETSVVTENELDAGELTCEGACGGCFCFLSASENTRRDQLLVINVHNVL